VYGRLKAIVSVVLALGLLQASAFAEVAPALGQVMQAENARLGGGAVASGATLFDGDKLVTQAAGTLRARLGRGQLYLLPESAAELHQSGKAVRASLERGTAMFTSLDPAGFELSASAAVIRAHAAQETLGQVTLTGLNEFVVTCQRGAIDVAIRGEVRTVEARNSYRVVVEPEGQGPQGAGSSGPGGAVAAGKGKYLWIPLLLLGAGTAYGIYRAARSVSSD
jgi:hypothetical protein